MSSLSQNEIVKEINPVEMLQHHLRADLEPLNETILKQLQSDVSLIPELAKHLIMAGGKRLRPLLTLASARLCGYEGVSHIALAASVELIHTATLLHDDVVDESTMRRGQEAANEIWDNKSSVLVGDFLYARSFELMVAQGSLDVLETLSWASAFITEGEVMQLNLANDLTLTQEQYFDIIQAKTAALFAAACKVGGQIAQQNPQVVESLFEFGMQFGICFQIVDDLLDYFGAAGVIGKTVGDDFREGKVTLPVLLTYQQATDEEKSFMRKCFEELVQEQGDLEKMLELLNMYNAFQCSQEIAHNYAVKAQLALEQLPQNPIRKMLFDLVQYSVKRLD